MPTVQCTYRGGLPSPQINRRHAIPLIATSPFILPSLISQPAFAEGDVITVGPNERYKTINSAIEILPADGGTLQIAPGRYQERLLLQNVVNSKKINIRAQPGAILAWNTKDHYEPALELLDCNSITISGLAIEHNSPSVANNYAVRLVNCTQTTLLEDCDVTSTSGSGMGIEGGSPHIKNCTFHNCKSNGMMLFGQLEGEESSSAVIENCRVTSNTQSGIVVRADATPRILATESSGNGAYGLVLQNCGGEFVDNVVKANGKGGVGFGLLNDVDIKDIVAQNQISGNIVEL